jgi:ParB family chromosome partitioning protein
MSKRRASLSDRSITPATLSRSTDDLVLGKERKRREVEEIPLREILPNRLQPRTQSSAEGLHELAESIRQHGVLEPIIVRQIPLTEYEGTGRRCEIVAGERRWRASALAGRETIPAIVVTDAADNRTMLELAIIENLQREDLHPLDEAMAFGRMQSELGYSYAQIAERLGKSKGYVQNRMRLLQLDEDLQLLVAERPDTLKHVIEIAKIRDSTARAELIAAVRDDALSFAATQARVQALITPNRSDPVDIGPTPMIDVVPATPEEYSREYDRDSHHEERRRDRPVNTSESYAHEYDSEDNRGDNREEGGLSLGQSPSIGSGSLLTARERSVLVAVTMKVERLFDDPGALTAEDWAILSPLALRLSDLLRQVGQAQRRARQ